MSFHTDYERWERKTRKENCAVCQDAPMTGEMVDVVELPASWLNARPKVCLRGQLSMTSKVHAVEVYDLTEDELLAFMKDVSACAKALKTVTQAVKINYEIHGNTVPHLHLHLFPRYLDDPFPGQPIDYRQVRSDMYGEGEFDAFVEALRRELARSAM